MLCGLDPGHGPGDGTMAGATPEHEYCWGMSTLIRELHGPGLFVSRAMGEDPSNRKRAERAARARVDLVVSLHVNAGTPRRHGIHVFAPPGDRAAIAAAEAMAEAWPRMLRRKRMRGRTSGSGTYYEGMVVEMDEAGRERWPRVANVMGEYARARVDCILVEMFYATHAADDAAAQDPTVQYEMALAIERGMVVYRREMAGMCAFPSGLLRRS